MHGGPAQPGPKENPMVVPSTPFGRPPRLAQRRPRSLGVLLRAAEENAPPPFLPQGETRFAMDIRAARALVESIRRRRDAAEVARLSNDVADLATEETQ